MTLTPTPMINYFGYLFDGAHWHLAPFPGQAALIQGHAHAGLGLFIKRHSYTTYAIINYGRANWPIDNAHSQQVCLSTEFCSADNTK